MITKEEAIRIAEEAEGDKVTRIRDCGDRWDIFFKSSEPNDPNFQVTPETDALSIIKNMKFDCANMFVHKKDGRVEYYVVSEYFDLLSKASKWIEC